MNIKFLLFCLFSPCLLQSKSSLEEVFTQAYYDTLAGKWGDVESASGPGSTLAQTEFVRNSLPLLIDHFKISSIIDAPCGDFHWMKQVERKGCSYIGLDVVALLIAKNDELYRSDECSFLCKNILVDAMPCADLVICRDFLVHLSDADIWKALRTFKQSGSKYLLTTSFPSHNNHNINSGDWRPLNLQQSPFNLPQPLIIINEHCTEQNGQYADKSMLLWKLEDILITS